MTHEIKAQVIETVGSPSDDAAPLEIEIAETEAMLALRSFVATQIRAVSVGKDDTHRAIDARIDADFADFVKRFRVMRELIDERTLGAEKLARDVGVDTARRFAQVEKTLAAIETEVREMRNASNGNGHAPP